MNVKGDGAQGVGVLPPSLNRPPLTFLRLAAHPTQMTLFYHKTKGAEHPTSRRGTGELPLQALFLEILDELVRLVTVLQDELNRLSIIGRTSAHAFQGP